MARILTFAGSLRSDSYNRRLIRIAAGGAEGTGADVTLVELADYPVPQKRLLKTAPFWTRASRVP